MWQCPKCETLNEHDECMICGEHKPVEEEKPKVVKVFPTVNKDIDSDDNLKEKNTNSLNEKSDISIAAAIIGYGFLLLFILVIIILCLPH